MNVVSINPADPREDRLEDAAAALAAGEVVALPTETFYGLAADVTNPAALGRINALKQKSADEALLLLLADREQVHQVACETPAGFDALAEKFWPGPLTLVVPARPDLAHEITGGRSTVAVRVPGLALPRRLAARLGHPITGVSANVHREAPARTAAEVARSFPEGVAMLLDGGPTPGGVPSTILDLTGDRPRLLRRGQVPASSLTPHLPDLVEASL